jgi:purine-cytosine permease-like protein
LPAHPILVRWWLPSASAGGGAGLLTLATVTTNFVNICMSALAFKSLWPASRDRMGVLLIGGIGAALGLLSTSWIEWFADLTLFLAGVFVPIGGILLAHYFVLRSEVHVPDLYDRRGPYRVHHGWSLPGTAAWAAGAATFYLTQSIGATLPSLVVSMAVYVVLSRGGVSRPQAAAPSA